MTRLFSIIFTAVAVVTVAHGANNSDTVGAVQPSQCVVADVTPAQAAAISFANDPYTRYASLGISVMDINTMKEVCSNNPMTANIPASTMKTVTCATALGILGPEYRFSTTVKLVGTKSTAGEFTGRIVVVGGGDPTLGSEHFERDTSFCRTIINALKGKGITSIVGEIDVRTCAGTDAYPSQWPLDDIVWDYGAGSFLFNYADNKFSMSFSILGDKVTLTKCCPSVSGISLRNDITFYSGKNKLPVSGIDCYRSPESSEIVLSGFSQRRDKKDVCGYTVSNPDPANYFKQVLADYLNRNGVKFTSKKAKVTNPVTETLTTYYSPELIDIATSALERSDNMFTESILRAIGYVKYGVWNERVGVKEVKKYWSAQGLDTDALFQRDGSGLARRNKVSARFLATMLAKAETTGLGHDVDYASALPVAGVNGTVKPLLRDTQYAGKVSLKSGSMGEVICYAGYYPVENPRYTIVVMVNNFSTNYRTMRGRIEKFLLELLPNLKVEE